MNSRVSADLQIACEATGVPAKAEMETWLSRVLAATGLPSAAESEISIRVVGEAESRALNLNYRHKDQATNVLAFPVDLPAIDSWPKDTAMPLGDLVICAPVVAREAAEQGKGLAAHWGHMLVHGMLHLLGYDHETDSQVQTMETLEIRILQAGGLKNPYEDQ